MNLLLFFAVCLTTNILIIFHILLFKEPQHFFGIIFTCLLFPLSHIIEMSILIEALAGAPDFPLLSRSLFPHP